MRVKFISMTLIFLLFCATNVFAEEGHGHHEQEGSMMEHMQEEVSFVIEVGNKICPVSGEKVGSMGPVVQHEYKGKVYNFCCTGCAETFKNDPERYVKIIEEQMVQHKQMDLEHGDQEHHHVMGEIDEHVMTEAVGEKNTQTKEKVAPSAQVKEFNLVAYQHGYSPERIVGKKGNILKLYATSRDVPHGIFIKEYGINVSVKKGTVEEIEFVADKVGEFDILCSVYCGRGHHSMKAKLIVEE